MNFIIYINTNKITLYIPDKFLELILKFNGINSLDDTILAP